MNPIRAHRRGWLVALVCLAAWAAPARAQLVTVTVQGVDELLDTVKYALNMAGQGEQAKQIDGMLEAFLQGEGFKGLDTKKPLGSYFTKLPSEGKPPKGVLFLPVTNEDDFGKLLTKLGVNTNKDDGGLHTVEIPNGTKVYMRIKDGYAFIGEDEEDLRSPLNPREFTKDLPKGTLFRVHVNLAAVPAALKAEFIKKMDEGMAKEKAKKEGEKDGEYQARMWGMQTVRNGFEQLVKDLQALDLALHLDRTKHVAAFEAAVTPVKGSALAAEIADMTKARTHFAGVTDSSVAYAIWSGIVNEKARADLNKILDIAVKEGIERETSVVKKAVAEKVYKVLEPTLKSDVIDLAVALRQASSGGPMTGVAALRVKNGKQIEQLLKDFAEGIKEKHPIKFDADKAGDVNIHVMTLPADESGVKQMKTVFGAAEAAIAFHDQAVVAALGKGCVDEVKRVLNGLSRDSERPASFQMEVHAKPFTRFEKNGEKRKVFEEAFSEPGSDLFRIAVSGGDRLQFRAQISTHFLKLGKAAQVSAE